MPEYHLPKISLHDTITLPLGGRQVPCKVQTVPQWYAACPGHFCTLTTPEGKQVLFYHPIRQR